MTIALYAQGYAQQIGDLPTATARFRRAIEILDGVVAEDHPTITAGRTRLEAIRGWNRPRHLECNHVTNWRKHAAVSVAPWVSRRIRTRHWRTIIVAVAAVGAIAGISVRTAATAAAEPARHLTIGGGDCTGDGCGLNHNQVLPCAWR